MGVPVVMLRIFAVVSIPTGLAGAQMVGPLPPGPACVVVLCVGEFFAGVIQQGETHDVQCTWTDCEPDVCLFTIVDVRLELSAALLPADALLLRAGHRHVAEAVAEGVPATALIEMWQEDTCIEAWVVGLRVSEPSPYVLRITGG